MFCITVSSQRTPTISYISQEQIKDIGGTVELECSVQYAQDYPVLWMRIDRSRQSDGLPISTGSTLIIRDSRFSLRYDTASSTYTLQVRRPFTEFHCNRFLLNLTCKSHGSENFVLLKWISVGGQGKAL